MLIAPAGLTISTCIVITATWQATCSGARTFEMLLAECERR
jgi:hypothetical protein